VRAELLLFACSNPPTAYYGLYTMKDDGTGIKPFITNQPAWAPGIAENGFDVTFVNPGQAASNIYLTTVYGAPPVAVPITNKAFAARCYGASDVLFLARRTANSFQLWRVGRNGSGERPVLATTFSVFPVGIEAFDVDSAADHAYVCGAGPSGMTLWRITVSNGLAVNLAITTNYYGDHYNPALSRDKTRLAYIADFYEGSHRVVVSPAQIAATAFVNVTAVYCGNPAWSRDGGAIAYTKAFASTFGSRSYVGYIAKTATNGIAEVNLTTNTICANRCAFPQYFTKPTTWHVSADGDDNNTGASWAAPLRTIQKAVDLAEAGNMIIVSNGVYAEGGRAWPGVTGALSNRVVIDKPVTVQSLNGPAGTRIVGGGPTGAAAVRCVAMIGGAWLSGFTITGGIAHGMGTSPAERNGGGVWAGYAGATITNCLVYDCSAAGDGGGICGVAAYACELARNIAAAGGGACSSECYTCSIVSNVANLGGGVAQSVVQRSFICDNKANSGGGAVGGALYSCLLTRNAAEYFGGGAVYQAALFNCTVCDNIGDDGGGVAYCSGLYNCIVTANFSNNHFMAGMNFSCSTPLAPGIGNIAANPQFAGTGDYHLLSGSPCINGGTNLPWMLTALDLDGNPRILPVGGVVDMGCYEFVPEPAGLGLLGLFTIYKFCLESRQRRERFTIWRKHRRRREQCMRCIHFVQNDLPCESFFSLRRAHEERR
jgi:hypothetical protein